MSCDDPCECEKFGIDYYGVLGVTKASNDLEIKQAFRRLAILCHPGRKEKSPDRSPVNFSLVAEAYDVLSDPLKRTVYDQYGEEGLKRGAPGLDDYVQPYVYHGEPMRTYREFFGTESPYADLLDALSLKPAADLTKACGGGGGAEGRGTRRRKEEALVQPLPLTLSEAIYRSTGENSVFFGGIKKMKIQRLTFANAEETETELRESVLTIPIAPGLPPGTEILFAEAGDQGPSKIPADLVFVTEDRPHETFKREPGEAANLSMTVKIFLREALVGLVVTVNTLDERTLRVPVTSIVTPDYEKVVTGEGLPCLSDEPERRGNLIIKFDVEFPVYLPLASKIYVKKAFKAQRSKSRKNVDEDIPLRRDRLEIEKLKLLCTN